MKKAFIWMTLGLTISVSSCSEDSTPNNSNTTSPTEAVDNHERSDNQRSTNVTTDASFSNETATSPRGRQVRAILTSDFDNPTARIRKVEDAKADPQIVWFQESNDGTEYTKAYWCHEDGTYDYLDLETGDEWWGWWYFNGDATQMAFDIDSDDEQTFEVSNVSNTGFTLSSANGSWNYVGYDINSDDFTYDYSAAEIRSMLSGKAWGYYHIYAEENDTINYLFDDVDISELDIEKYYASGKVDIYQLTDTTYSWGYDATTWEYNEENHAIIYGGDLQDMWYISYIDEDDVEMYRYDEEYDDIITYWMENVETYRTVDWKLETGFDDSAL